ncbi:hypothetical protein V4V34_07110 [Lysinibacillus sphaericus]|uniref:hypothetical protein n=1 Tax=Lysinibacillus sphaericus TaxID=1421 RepID=UPI0018CE282D|nr:hypothetical protein [Lysinibacillus sphaericus]MBG9756410.1 hypothetical protein [Lysinibacillus sphaericus]QTB12558.1 hypothetical protein J2B92_17100 [Lysinibacillus sphaericus]
MSNTDVLINSLLMSFLTQLVPIVIIALLAWLILSKIAKRFEKQNEERLALEKENSILINKKFDELNERLVIIEKMLKEVD